MRLRSLPGLSRVQLVFAAGALLLGSFGIAVASVSSQPAQPQAVASQSVDDSTAQSQHEANIAAPDISGLSN